MFGKMANSIQCLSLEKLGGTMFLAKSWAFLEVRARGEEKQLNEVATELLFCEAVPYCSVLI